jgi:hypothetical protein
MRRDGGGILSQSEIFGQRRQSVVRFVLIDNSLKPQSFVAPACLPARPDFQPE